MGLGGVLKLVGLNTTFTVAAHSEVQWGNSRLPRRARARQHRSMSSSNKIGALRPRPRTDRQLQTAATTNGDVYVSIVPFVKDVNVDSSITMRPGSTGTIGSMTVTMRAKQL